MNPWLRPEVYPLIGAIAIVPTLCVLTMARHLIVNPDVRVSKTTRTDALHDTEEQGIKYSEHTFRNFLRQYRLE